MDLNRSRIFFFLLCSFFLSSPVFADWINLTGAENSPNIAEIRIEKAEVTIDLEIGVDSFAAFIDLVPREFFQEKEKDLPPDSERFRLFAERGIQVHADGKRLPVKVGIVERRYRKERPSPFAGKINPYTRQIIPGPPEDKRVLFAKLSYPFTGKPKKLVFMPPFAANGSAEASIGFNVYHLGVPTIDYRFLSESAELTLDWDDPWYSKFKNKSLKRWQTSGMSTYLYIEPFEVRHETLVRVRDIEGWVDFGLKGKEFIEIDEFDMVRDKITEFLLKEEKVLIDGKTLEPIVDKVAFVESQMLRSRFIDTPERVPLNTAMVGVVFTYLTEGIPKEVTAEWNLFNDRIQKIPTTMTDPAGPFPYSLDPTDNVLTWKNFLLKYKIPTVEPIAVQEFVPRFELPILSILCLAGMLMIFLQFRKSPNPSAVFSISIAVVFFAVGIYSYQGFRVSFGQVLNTEEIDADAGKRVLHSLLTNIYRAFDFREEEDVYDKLALSVKDELLKRIYLESRKSLIIEQAGGAEAKVEKVDVKNINFKPSDNPETINAEAEWTIQGVVGHWGHTHMRENRYRANLGLDISTGSWKMAKLELLEEERLL